MYETAWPAHLRADLFIRASGDNAFRMGAATLLCSRARKPSVQPAPCNVEVHRSTLDPLAVFGWGAPEYRERRQRTHSRKHSRLRRRSPTSLAPRLLVQDHARLDGCWLIQRGLTSVDLADDNCHRTLISRLADHNSVRWPVCRCGRHDSLSPSDPALNTFYFIGLMVKHRGSDRLLPGT